MALNPYQNLLGNQDPLAIIESTPARLTTLYAESQPDDIAKSPTHGKWSLRDIICHLADTEIAFGFRLRQALAEPHHVVQPFDQDHWADVYHGLSASEALAAFEAARKWNVLLIKAAGPAARNKTLTHPERGEMTFQTLIETMAGHDLNHLPAR